MLSVLIIAGLAGYFAGHVAAKKKEDK